MKKLSPHPIRLQGLNPGEKIEMFLRRHPIVLWRKIIPMFLVGMLPVVVWIVLLSRTTVLSENDSAIFIIAVFLSSLFYLFLARMILTSWLDYYLDVWVITDERVLNIEQKAMFNRIISEQMLSRIQDITTHTKGFLATILHYGDIMIQTAAETEHFICHDIAHPEVVAQEITQLQKLAVLKDQGMGFEIKQNQATPAAPATPQTKS